MAKKSKRDLAKDAALEMLVDLIAYYREELKLVTAAGNPNHAKYMVDAGLRLISFIDTSAGNMQEKPAAQAAPGAALDPGKIATAFGQLIASQKAPKSHPLPTTCSVSDAITDASTHE